MTDTDMRLLDNIDALELGENVLAWKRAMKASGWKLYAEREKWTVESWRETEGLDIQLRRALLFKKVV